MIEESETEDVGNWGRYTLRVAIENIESQCLAQKSQYYPNGIADVYPEVRAIIQRITGNIYRSQIQTVKEDLC